MCILCECGPSWHKNLSPMLPSGSQRQPKPVQTRPEPNRTKQNRSFASWACQWSRDRARSCRTMKGMPMVGAVEVPTDTHNFSAGAYRRQNLNHCVASSAFCYNLRFMGDILQFTLSQKHFANVCASVRASIWASQSEMGNINYTVMCSKCNSLLQLLMSPRPPKERNIT